MGGIHPGQLIEGTKYQVIREIGAGGMGVVYEVEHVTLKKRYVAKVIHEQIKNEDGALKRMEREAQTLAQISHPNVVQVHDFGATADGVTYFVMEKLDGVDLRRFMKKHIPRWRAIEVIVDVLDALEHVHRRGIVHRDIKPENIFLAEQTMGAVTKVLDFGIVSIVDGDGRLSQGRITKTGGFVGTLYYAAPEQMQGKPPGPANDVYAAGLVLFELIAGKGPFDDDPGVGLSRCFKPAPRLADVAKAPRELSDAVARALEQDPAARPTAGVLAAELRRIGAGLKAMPGADDAVRAEVDDLLAQFGQVHNAPIRPAAGREVTPAPNASMGVDATAVPPTPVMPGAPARVPQAAVFEPTMASPEGHEPAVRTARPAVVAGQLAPTNVSPQGMSPHPAMSPLAGTPMPNSPTNLGVGDVQTGHLHHAQHAQGAHAMSAPPPSPRFPPPGTERGVGPVAMQPPPPRAMNDSNPGAAPRFSTSPGVYATVDGAAPSSASPRPSPPWAGIAMVGAAAVLAVLLIGGAFVYQRSKVVVASPAGTATAVPSAITAPAAPAPSAPTAVATTDPAPTTPTESPPTTGALAPSASSAAKTTTPITPVTPGVAAAKPQAPPAAPRPSASVRGAKKNGYMEDL